MDDIFVFLIDASNHEVHLEKLLGKIQSSGFKVNEKKFEFRQQTVKFLSYEVEKDDIRPQKAIIDALQSFKQPRHRKELLRYIGMFRFYQRCNPKYPEFVELLREI